MGELIHTILDRILNWASNNGRKINPSKSEIVLFTENCIVLQFSLPHIGDDQLNFAPQELILDRKLNWMATAEERIRKATIAFFTCRRLFRRNLGFESQMVYWLVAIYQNQ